MENNRIGRTGLALILIVVGLVFFMANIGIFSIDSIGEFFGNFGSLIGNFFGNLGGALGQFFGNFGRVIGEFFGSIGRWWPLILIVIGIVLVFRRPSDKAKRASEE